MKKIYGNPYLLSTLGSMVQRDRAAHSVIFHGEKGSGRKHAARYYTSLLLCKSPVDGAPCGVCSACKNVDSGSHPDVFTVPTSGKLGGYSVDTARSVCADAFIKPNNSSGRKIYIFEDCRNMDVRTQNTLLKLIEEPPDYAYFLFTSESKYEFLPTIISRCVCFGLSPCSDADTRLALRDNGFTDEETESAVRCFPGNVGMCIAYIRDDELRKQVDLTKRLADSIIRKDEYELNCAFYSLGSERSTIRSVLSMTDKLIRDAAALAENSGAETVSCFREGAVQLSQTVTPLQASRIHERIEKAWGAIEFNINIQLALAALSAEIIGIIL